jgi:hypothetical protein
MLQPHDTVSSRADISCLIKGVEWLPLVRSGGPALTNYGQEIDNSERRFVVFLSILSKIPLQCFNIDHSRFLVHRCQFITNHSTIRRHITTAVGKASLNK